MLAVLAQFLRATELQAPFLDFTFHGVHILMPGYIMISIEHDVVSWYGESNLYFRYLNHLTKAHNENHLV
jgi:hypothetical protein